ncbi:hypothetical protein CDAR_25251 [Caerostris darwini]|uniref:Uncharacterized protein n=1 Tax=Caerostris darwini TaxID=1538125 RepID=A0AAV4PGL7_9ARAC|nr:hypothetical protein CDAR_25251 [Caerostris darwini]
MPSNRTVPNTVLFSMYHDEDTLPSPPTPVPVFATTAGRDNDELRGHPFWQVLSNCIDRLLMDSEGRVPLSLDDSHMVNTAISHHSWKGNRFSPEISTG